MKQVRRKNINGLVLLALGTFFFFPASTMAADPGYPSRPVSIIIGGAPGAATSIGATIVLEGLPRYSTKQKYFVLNHKGGAGHMVATDSFMNQPADGYNLMWYTSDTSVALAKDPKKYSFTVKDFVFLSYFYYAPYVVVVYNDSPYKTFEEFIDYAQKHPGELTCGTGGIGGAPHLTLEMLMSKTGVKIKHVPFPSGTASMTAMLGGHITCSIPSFGSVSSHLKGGRARALVVFDSKRDPRFPDVPTARERGLDLISSSGHSAVAKKGTPKAVFDYLVKLFEQLGNDPTVQSNLINAGFTVRYMGPEETEKFVKNEYEMVSNILQKLDMVDK